MRRPVISKKSFALIFACVLAMLCALALFFFSRLQNERALARSAATSSARMAGFPKQFLWAWERPEQLEFIDTREVGVAFLSKTIYLREDKVIERPRMQPLKVPAGTTLMAVVRIETVRDGPPLLSDTQRASLTEALLEASRAPNVRALQIDFDALKSEREFYTKLLRDLRRQLPAEMPLSITALASWCIDDNWLDGLPVDEAVPMLFQMGMDEERIRSYLKQGGELRSPLCRLSKGVSTDEPVELASQGVTRTYIFNSKAWTEAAVRRTIERNRK
ncbi:MAG TPA: DUF3142 domain-containing protein [Pyrinomonadaceae bacterium]|jgi:hypothetical protein